MLCEDGRVEVVTLYFSVGRKLSECWKIVEV